MPTPPHILHPTPAHCAGVTPAHPAPHPRTVCGAPPQNRTPPNIRNHQKTVTEPNGVCAITEFELFWSAYPKKEGRLEAERAFVEVMGKDKTADILAGIAAQKKAEAWMKDQGRYIPAPARWLREGRWKKTRVLRTMEIGLRFDIQAGPTAAPGAVQPARVAVGGNPGTHVRGHSQGIR